MPRQTWWWWNKFEKIRWQIFSNMIMNWAQPFSPKKKKKKFIHKRNRIWIIHFGYNLKCLEMKLLNLSPPPFFFSSFSTLPRFPPSSFSLSIPSHLPFNPLPSSSPTSLRRLRCRAALPDPPPPHNSDQPPGNDSTQLQSKFFNSILILGSFGWNWMDKIRM